MLKKLTAVFVLALCLGGATFVLMGLGFVNNPMGSAGDLTIFEVQPGESFYKVAERLEQQELVSSAFKLRILGRILGASKNIRVGEYQLHQGMSPKDILEVLSSGKSITRPLTVQEGLNMFEIAELASEMGIGTPDEIIKKFTDKKLIKELLGRDLHSLEGYLFPETYHLTKYTTPEELAEIMVSRFKTVYAQLQRPSDFPLDDHEIVILGSLIEKETGAPEERPIISSVFHNRLRQKMRLASDPTILYGILDETGVMPKDIRKKDIRAKTRYNTYAISGLPYGPIANPGEESLKAVLNPDDTDYLYFVSRNDGTHVFSKTLRDHNEAVKKYQLDKKMREGKSWRDRLNK